MDQLFYWITLEVWFYVFLWRLLYAYFAKRYLTWYSKCRLEIIFITDDIHVDHFIKMTSRLLDIDLGDWGDVWETMVTWIIGPPEHTLIYTCTNMRAYNHSCVCTHENVPLHTPHTFMNNFQNHHQFSCCVTLISVHSLWEAKNFNTTFIICAVKPCILSLTFHCVPVLWPCSHRQLWLSFSLTCPPVQLCIT